MYLKKKKKGKYLGFGRVAAENKDCEVFFFFSSSKMLGNSKLLGSVTLLP